MGSLLLSVMTEGLYLTYFSFQRTHFNVHQNLRSRLDSLGYEVHFMEDKLLPINIRLNIKEV